MITIGLHTNSCWTQWGYFWVSGRCGESSHFTFSMWNQKWVLIVIFTVLEAQGALWGFPTPKPVLDFSKVGEENLFPGNITNLGITFLLSPFTCHFFNMFPSISQAGRLQPTRLRKNHCSILSTLPEQLILAFLQEKNFVPELGLMWFTPWLCNLLTLLCLLRWHNWVTISL